jgi:hypothetical protein
VLNLAANEVNINFTGISLLNRIRGVMSLKTFLNLNVFGRISFLNSKEILPLGRYLSWSRLVISYPSQVANLTFAWTVIMDWRTLTNHVLLS